MKKYKFFFSNVFRITYFLLNSEQLFLITLSTILKNKGTLFLSFFHFLISTLYMLEDKLVLIGRKLI